MIDIRINFPKQLVDVFNEYRNTPSYPLPVYVGVAVLSIALLRASYLMVSYCFNRKSWKILSDQLDKVSHIFQSYFAKKDSRTDLGNNQELKIIRNPLSYQEQELVQSNLLTPLPAMSTFAQHSFFLRNDDRSYVTYVHDDLTDSKDYRTQIYNKHPFLNEVLDNSCEFVADSEALFYETISLFLKGTSEALNEILQNIISQRAQNISQLNQLEKKPFKIVVIGQGVGGLIAALEAYKAGCHVTRVEKRSEISRDQILRLDESIMAYFRENFKHLISLYETNEMIQSFSSIIDYEIFANNPSSIPNSQNRFFILETRALEFLISSLLDTLMNHPENSEGGLLSYTGYEFKSFSLSGVEEKQWNCILQNQEREIIIPADYVVGADGASSKVRNNSLISWNPISNECASGLITFPNLFSPSLGSSQLLFFAPEIMHQGCIHPGLPNEDEKTILTKGIQSIRPHQLILMKEEQGISTIHDRARFTSPSRFIQQEIDLVARGSLGYLRDLRGLGWELNRPPINRLFFSSHTIYLGTDVPESQFLDMKSENDLPLSSRLRQLNYFKKALEANFPKYIIDFLLPYTRKSFVFRSALFKSETAFKELIVDQKSLGVFLLGDAYSTPQFQTGSGGFKAILDGIAFGKMILEINKNGSNKHLYISNYQTELSARADKVANKAFQLGVLQPLRDIQS